MLDSLMQREFEYGLQDKTLKLSLQQLQSITDKLSEFNINIERFNETKEIFVNRIEGKNDETRLELR